MTGRQGPQIEAGDRFILVEPPAKASAGQCAQAARAALLAAVRLQTTRALRELRRPR